jgi:hypothetical protein
VVLYWKGVCPPVDDTTFYRGDIAPSLAMNIPVVVN